MRYSYAALAGALMGVAAAQTHEPRTQRKFAVMRFNGDPTFQGMVDPIVNPGKQSTHEHTVFGGSNFSPDADGVSMFESKCTSAKLKGDKSAYWVPTVFFNDGGKFERVPVMYANVYYFFEPTDDYIEAFPLGLAMLAGDASLRQPGAGAAENLNPDKDINNAIWTCPRQNLDNPGWPKGSDGSTCGMQDPNNKGQGVGFPTADCDADNAPLRADIHFPSCYNKDKAVGDYKNNMVWPTHSNGKQNCPEGYMHVPHIFVEVYWQTKGFRGRWTPGGEEQPFVLSNGDVTGYSLHADFLSGWDRPLLQRIIDGCNNAHEGMEKCPEVKPDEVNTQSCKCEGSVLSMASASSGTLTSLPGNCPLSGFKYGAAAPMAPAADAPEVAAPQQGAVKPVEDVVEDIVEDVVEPVVEQSSPEVEQSSPEGAVFAEEPAAEEPTPVEPQCVTKTKTVMETVTVYADAPAEKKKRHLHRHQARHH